VAASDATGADGTWPEAAETLRRERLDAVDQIAAMSALVGEIIAASADVATDDEHDPDGQTIAYERAQATALLSRARARLDDIDAALGRLRAGTYGVCERCGQPIGPERLAARPAAGTCIGCASLRS
jgi:RNA polymerase-binding transcription factor